MSRLNDPLFINFDGTPVTGRAPPVMRVAEGRQLTMEQFGRVSHVYKLFRDAVRVMVGDYLVQHRVLLDGTRVRMESMQGRDVVYVWPSAEIGGEFVIPHGFLVMSSFSDPMFYCRSEADGSWEFRSPHIPQTRSLPIKGLNQFVQSPTDPGQFTVYPSVVTQGEVWDWAPHSATALDGDTPILARVGTEQSFHRPHEPRIARAHQLRSMTGEVLFTMVDEVPWWAYIYPDGQFGGPPSTVFWNPTYIRPVTDTAGSVVIFTGFRLHTYIAAAETNYVQSQSAVVTIGLNDTYTPAYTRCVFSPPLLAPVTTITSSYTYDLGGEVPDSGSMHLKGYNLADNMGGWHPPTWCGPATSYALAGGYFDWDVEHVWRKPQFIMTVTAPNLPVTFTPSAPVVSQSTYTSDTEIEAGPEVVIDGVAVVPLTTGAAIAKLRNNILYPYTSFFRAGYITINAENVSGAWDTFGVDGLRIDRRDAQVSMDAWPKLTLDMGEIQVVLFEGNACMNLTGHWYRDWNMHRFSATVRDAAHPGKAIAKAHPGISPPPVPTASGQSTYYGEGYQEIFEAALWTEEEINEAGWGGTPRMDVSTPYVLVVDDKVMPEQTASYWFRSRYIIDCDTRASLVVSLVVEVISSGAKWVQGDWHMGLLATGSHPSYTVNILAECMYKGVKTTKLLLTGTCTRYAMEYQASEHNNPYTHGSNSGSAPSMWTYWPPKASPHRDFYKQLQGLTSCQSRNTNFAAADNIAEQDEATISPSGLEYTRITEDGVETALTRTASGLAYTRVIRLSDFYDALWLLRDLKIDARQNDINNEELPKWYYMPEFGASLNNDYHVLSIRDGQFVDWVADIPKKKDAHGNDVAMPEPKDRDVKLYRI